MIPGLESSAPQPSRPAAPSSAPQPSRPAAPSPPPPRPTPPPEIDLGPEPEPILVENPNSEILLAAARPDLYRLNAFRVMSAPVGATTRDIKRQTEKLIMMERLGATASLPGDLLPLDPPPDADALREATQRLHAPERRLMDELFWFWPRQPDQDDEVLALLERDGAEAAANAWRGQEDEKDGSVARHNLAVLWHLLALDLERAETLGESERQKRDEYWDGAFQRWQALADDENFWRRLTVRMRELDDPRLTAGTVRRLRATLPRALLSINAQLAVQAAESQEFSEAQRHAEIMRSSGFPEDTIDDALRSAVEPVRNRVRTLCENAESEADADHKHANQVTRRLAEQSGPPLKVIDNLLPEGHPTRDGVHDEVALRLLACQIVFGNKTKKWEESLELLRSAIALAASDSVRSRIQTNIATLDENIELGKCFFCASNPADDKVKHEVKMYGNVITVPTYEGTHTTWNKITLSVPRCESCKKAHGKVEDTAGFSALLGGIIGIGACFATPGDMEEKGCAFAIATVVLLVIMMGIGHLIGLMIFTQGIRGEGSFGKFPAVKKLLDEGWKLGDGPEQTP